MILRNHFARSLLFTFFASTLFGSVLQAQKAAPDAWDTVLSAAGVTKSTARFDFTDMANYGGGEFPLPFFEAMHRFPLRVPFYARVLRSDALKAAPAAGELVMAAGWRMDHGSRRTLIGDPLKDDLTQSAEADALLAAIRALHIAAGKPLTAAQEKKLKDSIKTVPADVAQNAALLLRTEARALGWRERALARFTGHDLQKVFAQLIDSDAGDRDERKDALNDLRRAIDLHYMMVGGTDLALSADKAASALEKRDGAETFRFEWDAPQGRIVLNGAGDDQYAGDRPYLLIIDAGGNDTYFGGGATYDGAHGASVLLDLGGNDRYLGNAELAATAVADYADRKKGGERPSFGAGVLGYGILVDIKGDDFYRALSNTQGRGLFGVGVLHDRAGNDRYESYTAAQGAGSFGVGVLADLDGADEYRCFTTSQGFGATWGCGLLVDAGEGDDLYEANDKVIDFPAPQDQNHNATLAQGMGYGRRADYSDGHSLRGGVGALIEGGGKNSFSCGVYGQGAGYWYGAGILSAGSGDDTYRGVYYTQGATAHFAVGVLWDTGGNDDYRATTHASQGLGHDFGTGFLIDDAGNDNYQAPGLSMGAGNANGFGFFWDKAGDDTYAPSPGTAPLFGGALTEASARNSIRERNLTLGIFLDTGGNDTYPPTFAAAQNNTLWTMPRTDQMLPAQRGAGLDVEANAAALDAALLDPP